MKKILNFFLFILLLLPEFAAHAQEKDDSIKNFKNVVRLNITNPMLFGEKNFIIGYERVLKNHQTISANVGLISFPKWKEFNNDSVALSSSYKDRGFGAAIDYRFYLKKENKYVAPRGVYIGPYYTFNYFNRVNTWTLNTSTDPKKLETDISMTLNLVGFQLGYQFVLWNRMTIDLVLLGPGRWFYTTKLEISTNLTNEEEELLFQEINDAIDAKLPGNSIEFRPFELRKKGSVSSSFSGFRYVAHIGFRF